jgi:rhomboid protease GluP
MLNDPKPPEEHRRHPLHDRPRHPLEDGPPPPPPPPDDAPERPQMTLRIPVVRPYVTYALLAINVLIFAVGFLSPSLRVTLFGQGASRAYEVLVEGEFQRLFTAMFLHANTMHIFFNMYALYIIGRGLEPIFGNFRFLLIYLLGGLAGSTLSVVLGNPDPFLGVPSVGASGAVFALFGAEMVYLYRHRRMMGARATRQIRGLLMLLGVNLFIGLASWLGSSGIRIDNWAHIGGLVGGLVLTWLLGPVFSVQPDPQQPTRLMAQDNNPLPKNYWLVSLYIIFLAALLAVVSYLLRLG